MKRDYLYLLLVLLFSCFFIRAKAQSVPEASENFFERLTNTKEIPGRLLSGRTLFVFDEKISMKELELVQNSFVETGIDAVLAMTFDEFFAGYDAAHALHKILEKREVHNLLFLKKTSEGFQCITSTFTGSQSFVNRGQASWQAESRSLADLLINLKRNALANLPVKNLLINHGLEMDVELALFSGSRIEGFTADLKNDRIAMRLSTRNEENEALRKHLSLYAINLEFVPDSIPDDALRKKGFWYVLNATYGRETTVRKLLGYTEVKPVMVNREYAKVYKFYFRKLEFESLYLGKMWDAAPTWELALQNFLTNFGNEVLKK